MHVATQVHPAKAFTGDLAEEKKRKVYTITKGGPWGGPWEALDNPVVSNPAEAIELVRQVKWHTVQDRHMLCGNCKPPIVNSRSVISTCLVATMLGSDIQCKGKVALVDWHKGRWVLKRVGTVAYQLYVLGNLDCMMRSACQC